MPKSKLSLGIAKLLLYILRVQVLS